MARRRKGREISGWLVLDKPGGLGSTDAVARVRRAFDARKAGHAGTLDPAATGILAIALGEATKTVPWLTEAAKTYRFTVRWGAATDTDDAEGRVIATSDRRPTPDAIEAALDAFRGDIMQVPPQVSAVKVDGERAYDLARAGEVMDLAARPLRVERLALLATPDADHAEFEMICGKGGYVRSIARDLGAALGCLGHVLHLRRTRVGPFGLEDALSLDTVMAEAGSDALDDRLLPLQAALADLPELPATAEGAARLVQGNPGQVRLGTDYGAMAWASHAGRALAVGQYRDGMLFPNRVFRTDV